LITLINGPKTVNLKLISRSILDAEKVWTFGDYTVKYRDNGFIVFDSNKNNVYCNNEKLGQIKYDLLLVDDEQLKEKNESFIREIDQFNDEITDKIFNVNKIKLTWANTNLDNLFSNFKSLVSDVDEILLLKNNTLLNSFYSNEQCEEIILQNLSDYQDFLTHLNEESDNQIWTGVFSASFIERIRSDLGRDNVRVINFLRNPSSCSFINHIDYKVNEKYNEDPDRKERQFEEFLFSILNMVMVKSLPDVINIKYEDFLNEGKFILDGKEVFLRQQLSNYNGIINEFEYEQYNPTIVDDTSIQDFNEIFSDFDSLKNIKMIMKPQNDVGNLFENYFVDIFVNDLNLDAISEIPKSFFEYLNYTPLNIQQIIHK